VEYLRIKGFVEPDDFDVPLKLRNLLVLQIADEVDLPHPFAADLIETPNLQEVKIDLGSWAPCDDNEWRKFLKQNPGIKKLTIPAKVEIVKQIRESLNVRDLGLGVKRSNGNKWLLELAGAEAEGSSEGEGSRICPNLRSITILFQQSSTLPSYSDFDKLIRSRYIPVRRTDDELYTEVGYEALETLVLHFMPTEAVVMEAVEASPWTGADVEKISTKNWVEYRLRWPYRDSDIGGYEISKDLS
jgi:hypothetical protein